MAKMDQLPVCISYSPLLKPGAQKDGYLGVKVGKQGQDSRADKTLSSLHL